MDRRNIETVGVRRTGWAALDRDPQEDRVEFVCPHCGTRGQKNARRERTQYHFTDGFLQDLQGEVTQCRSCSQSLRVVPVVMLHDQDETRRFEAVFSDEIQVPSQITNRFHDRKFRTAQIPAKTGRQKRPVCFFSPNCMPRLRPRIPSSSDRPEPTDRSAPLSSGASSRSDRTSREHTHVASTAPAHSSRGVPRQPADGTHTPAQPARSTLHQKT